MHHVFAIAFFLALLQLDRLVDDIPQDMPLFRQNTRTGTSGLPFTQVSRFGRSGGWVVCMHACLSKCFLLWKMQYTLAEDFFLQICHLPQFTHSLLIHVRCTIMRTFQCIWFSANSLMSAANDWIWFVLLHQNTNAGNTYIKCLESIGHDARYV
jgi:hypothetical protein